MRDLAGYVFCICLFMCVCFLFACKKYVKENEVMNWLRGRIRERKGKGNDAITF